MEVSTISILKRLLFADSQRYGGGIFRRLRNPGYRYSFWLRITAYCLKKNKIFYFLSNLILRHYKYKYGIEISPRTQIGKGLYIGHFGGIVVNSGAIIGKNVNLSHGVTIGSSNRGSRVGNPTIGNNVFIAPGAKIFGNIIIGDNVAIGANAVVISDIPVNVSVGGIPAKVISSKGAGTAYIQNPQ